MNLASVEQPGIYSILLGDSRYVEKKLSECTRKNDEFNSLAK